MLTETQVRRRPLPANRCPIPFPPSCKTTTAGSGTPACGGAQTFTRPASEPGISVSRWPSSIATVGWGPSIAGRTVLCLASGGGSQSALYAAAGAKVTVVDISAEMLALDRAVAAERQLDITCIQASMDDLAGLAAGGFDIVIQPVSTCYVPDIEKVYREVARVTAPGGLYISQHKQPTSLQAGIEPDPPEGYPLTEPYYRTGPLPGGVGSPHREPGTLEFLHRWEMLVVAGCAGPAFRSRISSSCRMPTRKPRSARSATAANTSPYVRIKARRDRAPQIRRKLPRVFGCRR